MRVTGGTLPPTRVSDAERERALRMLREASVEGRLSSESFVGRVDDALRSHNRDELADVVRDLPGRPRLADAAVRTVSSVSLFAVRIRSAWSRARLDRLPLPADGERSYVLGRDPRSELVLSHPTVSWRHARLEFGPDGWVLVDLGSTNGTRVNGWRIRGPQPVRSGDQVLFGLSTLVITH